jgi:manganese/zinc/iron transport system permease protein
MVTPAAAAYLLTDDLRMMLLLSVLIGAVSAIAGYWLAHSVDGNIAGAMATMTGVSFLLVLLFAPNRGLVAVARRRARQRWEFALAMLTIHLLQHEREPDSVENRVDHLVEHIRWQPDFAEKVVRYAERKGAVRRQGGRLHLTDMGRTLAQQRVVTT